MMPKVIWEMFTENDCNTFADLKGKLLILCIVGV